MDNIDIRFWKKKSLSQFVLEEDGSLSIVSLFALGMMAALAHQHLRLGLNLPGHHGLEWMTLLLFGRMQSRHARAGLLIALAASTSFLLYAAASALPLSIKPIVGYFISALFVDALLFLLPAAWPLPVKAFFLGGLSFMMKPLLVFVALLVIAPDSSGLSQQALLFPLVSHFMFGSIGAICGMTLANAGRKEIHSQNP